MRSLPRYLSQFNPRTLALVFFLAGFGTTLLALGLLYAQAVKYKENALHDHVRDVAVAAAAMVDLELHERLVQKEQFNGPDYRAALAPLVLFHRARPDIQFLWTVRVGEQNRMSLILATVYDPAIRATQEGLGRSQAFPEFLYSNPTLPIKEPEAFARLRRGEVVVLPKIYEDAWGRYIEARAPMTDTSGRFIGYVGIDYALDRYEQQLNEVRQIGVACLALSLVLSLLMARVVALMRRETFAAQAEIIQQRDRADRANDAKGELLRIAAHDLKNPLAAVAGMSGLLLQQMRKRPEPVASDVQVLETIHGSAQHMSEIVRGILMNEGLEQGGLPFQPAPLDLAALAATVVQFNTPNANRKNIAVQTASRGPVPVVADGKLLREAFDNFVSNAIKYSPPGRKVTVAASGLADGGAEFSVADEGPGLSEADQAGLFQKFKRLTPRPTGGETSTGLGLSIVKTIMDLHGGTVGCDTAPGRGARFWLRLPAGQKTAGRAAAQP